MYFHAYDSLRLLPAFVLRRLVLGSFPQGVLSPPVANSVDFMVEQVDRRTLCLSAAFVNLFFLFRASKLRVHCPAITVQTPLFPPVLTAARAAPTHRHCVAVDARGHRLRAASAHFKARHPGKSVRQRLTSQITIIDVLDTCAISAAAREEVIKCYPSARLAQLRVGPNVPFVKDRSAATFPRSPRPTTSTCFCRCSRCPLESPNLPTLS